MNEKVYLLAGEPSGDSLAASLVKTMKQEKPSAEFRGVAGPLMIEAGVAADLPMDAFTVMGFTAVIAALPRIWRLFRQVRRQILEYNPGVVVLVDYPDFNLLLAKSLRKRGYKGRIVQYGCPTVWAWRKARVHTLERYFDKVLCLYPFEPEFLGNTDVSATYVGHPSAAIVANYSYDPSALDLNGAPVLAIFPGSRRSEVELTLPTVLEAVLKMKDPQMQVAISVANERVAPLIQEQLQGYPLQVTLVPAKRRFELMRVARAAIAASGTVCLELALHQLPAVVVYEVSRVNRLIAQYIAKLDLEFYCNVNIIAGREIYPERIAINFSTHSVLEAIEPLWQDSAARQSCLSGCEEICKRLDIDDASKQAAKAVDTLLHT